MDHFFNATDSLYKESEICYSGLQILSKDKSTLEKKIVSNCFTTFFVSMEKKETNIDSHMSC